MNILLIRATSLQHTACVVSKVTKRFKSKVCLDILSHGHVIGSLNKWFDRGEIITYPFKNSFCAWNILFGKLKSIQKQSYDLVVVPSENISGVGYENIFIFAFCLLPGKIVLCNRKGDLKFFSKGEVFWFWIKKQICFFPAVLITVFFIIRWFYHLIKNLCRQKKNIIVSHKK